MISGVELWFKEQVEELLKNRRKEKMAENEKKRKVHVVDIVRHGDKMILPETLTYKAAIDVLHMKMVEEEEVIQISEDVDAFVWDGALAMVKAMEEMYGFAIAKAKKTQSFFGEMSEPPKMISVEVGFNETSLVPWGRFQVPGIEDGYVETGIGMNKGRAVFSVNAQVKRKYEATIHQLINRTREIVKEQSIYKGKAFKIRFRDDKGKMLQMPMPSFLDVDSVNEKEIVFSEDVERAINTNLYTPIERSKECRYHHIPLKRGVLLSGDYGTGKTLVAYATAKMCIKNDWTFIYVERADEISDVIKFSHQYQPAVIFCEDIDRVVAGERCIVMDDILNVIDGIESKNTELMVVLTTNHVEKINQAMLRPGRLDAVVNVTAPDAKAVEQLIRVYGRELVPNSENLTQVGVELEGKIPAVIRECVERAKLSAIKYGGHKDGELSISGEAMLDAAIGMKHQLELLEKKSKNRPGQFELLGAVMGKSIGYAVHKNGVAEQEADNVIERM